MNTVVIIQARMGSTRLPGKVLLPLSEGTILKYVVDRCNQITKANVVVVATTTLKADDEIFSWCMENEIECFRGSEEDVLARYYECAKSYSADYIMRVTSDCPFIDYELGNEMIDSIINNSSDIVRLDGELPRGLEPQIVSFEALDFMYHHAFENRYREHVTYYAYENPEQFKSSWIVIDKEMNYPELRVTVDTEEDYTLMKVISTMLDQSIHVSSRQIVEFLLKNPSIASINSHVQQKPVQ